MKLLHCTGCGDIVRLYVAPRSCHCGQSRGHYASITVVVLRGPCRAIGIDTGAMVRGDDHGTWAESSRVEHV